MRYKLATNKEGTYAMKVVEHRAKLDREQKYHLDMAGCVHKHLVRCLASFTLGSQYWMVRLIMPGTITGN
jgi:hypothetical protein